MQKSETYSDTKETLALQGEDKVSLHVLQNENWERIKQIISLNIKEIIWKAWIEPLSFVKYEKKKIY